MPRNSQEIWGLKIGKGTGDGLSKDLERSCDECKKCHKPCKWLEKSRQKACTRCAGMHIKCLLDGVLVTQRVPRRTGGSPTKRHRFMAPEVLETISDMTKFTGEECSTS